jgi:hypothetical protein
LLDLKFQRSQSERQIQLVSQTLARFRLRSSYGIRPK